MIGNFIEAIETIVAIETIDAIEAIDAIVILIVSLSGGS